jgi:class 3 adenylate cyclase
VKLDPTPTSRPRAWRTGPGNAVAAAAGLALAMREVVRGAGDPWQGWIGLHVGPVVAGKADAPIARTTSARRLPVGYDRGELVPAPTGRIPAT